MWSGKWQPTPVFLPGESHGQRKLAGCSPWGCESRTRLSDFDYFDLTITYMEVCVCTHTHTHVVGLPWWLNQQRICLQCRRLRFDPWVRKNFWRREWLPTAIFLPRKSHGERSLEGTVWGLQRVRHDLSN